MQTVTGTVYVYEGAGTSGTLLDARPFALTTSGTANAFFPVIIDAFPVTMGTTYTFFIDITQGTLGLRVWNQGATTLPSADAYTGGVHYQSTSTGPAGAAAISTFDLQFVVFFNELTTVSQVSAYDGAGWRLLSPPVYGVTVNDLAGENLVQGVPAGTAASRYPAQYPNAPVGSNGLNDNLLTNYNGNGTSAGFTGQRRLTVSLTPVPGSSGTGTTR